MNPWGEPASAVALSAGEIEAEAEAEAEAVHPRILAGGVVRAPPPHPLHLTFASLLQACGRNRALLEGKRLHTRILALLHPHTFSFSSSPFFFREDQKLSSSSSSIIILCNHVIRMYDLCHAPGLALRAFQSMPARNRVSWNLVLAAHSHGHGHGHAQTAFRLLLDMLQQQQSADLSPDKFTFITVISACAKSWPAFSLEGKITHFLLVCYGLDGVGHAANALIAFYGMCGHLDDALRILGMMPKRDVSAWNSIFTVCSHLGESEMVFQLYAQMQQEGIKPNKVSFLTLLSACRTLAKLDEGKQLHSLIKTSGMAIDVVLGTALMDMYSKCGDFDSALKVFTGMPAGNHVSWSAIISAHAKHGYGEEACLLYGQMHKEGMKANINTLLSLLETCSATGNLVAGKLLHSCIVDDDNHNEDNCNDNAAVKNALISMYNRCGSLMDAHAVFKNTSNIYDTVSWNAMISANSQHGNSSKALDLFLQMQMKGIKPTENTFISVLSACSHTGLLTEGLLYFCFMCYYCGIMATPQHYTCIIDLLGRAGRLEEAEEFVKEMPLKAGVLDWMSLASASRGHGDMERARYAAKQTLELNSLVTGAYVALTNILAVIDSGWDDESEY